MAAHLDEKELAERDIAKTILKAQIQIEGELIELYEKTANESPNSIIQQMLKMIIHDSQKHIMMLGIVTAFLEGKEVYIEDRKNLSDSLKHHLELETVSIQNGEKLLKHIWLQDRKGYRTIIEAWVEDERRHHKFLKELSDRPYTPINSDDFASAFRDESFFEERYRRSKAYWDDKKDSLSDH